MRHPDPVPTAASPNALAAAMARTYAPRLRHVAAWKCWMVWDQRCWRRDDTLLATNLAREVCWQVAVALRGKAPAASGAIRRLGCDGTIAQVERLARADRHVAASPAQFDADPNLLNTPAGIVDLRSGDIGPHRADAFMTRMTPVAPAPAGTPCPAWYAWLDRITGGDAPLQFFLQRVAGRALAAADPAANPNVGRAPAAGPARSTFITTLLKAFGDDRAAAALRDCVGLLPAAVRRADAVREPWLDDRLARERAGILRWAIDGAVAWHEIGLEPPESVRQAAAEGAAAGDALDLWLDESAERCDGAWESGGALYASWTRWAELSGVPVGSHKRFSQAMAARGFSLKREGSGRRGCAGLRLREPAQEACVASVDASADPRPTAASLRPGARDPGLAPATDAPIRAGSPGLPAGTDRIPPPLAGGRTVHGFPPDHATA